MEREQIAAIHEAAHAVIAYRFGLVCSVVSIVADSKSDGRCVLPINDIPDEERIIVLYSGEIAHCRFTGEKDLPGSHFDGLQILESAVKLTEKWGMDRSHIEVPLLKKEAQRLVGIDWPVICAVAALLMEKKTVNASELLSILTDRTHRNSH